MPNLKILLTAVFIASLSHLHADVSQKVADIPTRAGVTQRIILLSPPEPKAAAILFAGGHGGLQVSTKGSMNWGEGNFLIRSRKLFAEAGLTVVVVDAPSDRQTPPFLSGFRQSPEHAADVKAVISWLREAARVPVWLIGTSRGTQSAAYIATQLVSTEGADGLVLTSTILKQDRGRPVQAMPLGRIRIPVLVVHHEQDGCAECPFSEVPTLMGKLENSPRTQLIAFQGGVSKGDPCEAFAYHGFNGIEREVVQKIVAWILTK